MKKYLAILFVITFVLTSSAAAFAAVVDGTSTVPLNHPSTALGDGYGTSTDDYSINGFGLNDEFVGIDSIGTAGDVSLVVPKGWDASMTSDSHGEYLSMVSSNGYQIHLNVSYSDSFATSYTDTKSEQLTAIKAKYKAVVGMDDLYVVQTNDNTIWLSNSGQLPIHGNVIAKGDYFYPRFKTPAGHMAELYGFQGPYKSYNQCRLDEKTAEQVIEGIGVVDFD